jgi:hypothetical protein
MTERAKKNINNYAPGLYHCESSDRPGSSALILVSGSRHDTETTRHVLYGRDEKSHTESRSMEELPFVNSWDYCTPITSLTYEFAPPPPVPQKRTFTL